MSLTSRVGRGTVLTSLTSRVGEGGVNELDL